MVERWEYQADITSLLTTGHWVDNEAPEWARTFAEKLGISPGDPVVLMYGYQQIIKLLEEELTRAQDRADASAWLP